LASSRKKPARKAAKKPAKPVREPKAGKPQDFGETCLHKHCQQWLEKSGLWSRLLIFHVPNERKGGIGAILHFKRMGVRTGVADYLLFTSRRSVAIELKDANGEQRREQEIFQAQWEATGHAYHLVRTLEEFQAVVLFG
jgi:hypothetical protein